MYNPIIQQIRDINTQLDLISQELAKEKSEKKIIILLKQSNALVHKRNKLAKQLGLTSWDGLL